jgi:uncharacterized protein (DUF433 family)
MSTIVKTEKPQQPQRGNKDSVEIFPGIKSTPGVCGGWACVGNSRITVSGLVELRRLGCDDARLLDAYPTLTQTDLTNAWEYARLHGEEMEREIAENNED